MPEIRIFAGNSSRGFAEKMCSFLGIKLGESSTIKFSDKNIFVRVDESIRNSDVFIVQSIGKSPNDELVELLFWIDAFKRASASSVTAIIPYFGYAKGDKKDEPRVSIRARVCADCIETVGADRVITMDLHSAQVQGFFTKPVDHLYGQKLLCEYARRMGIVDDDLVIVSPDAGFAKRARLFATELDRPVAIGDKVRTAHDENAKVLEIIGDVKGKNCLVVDDFTISGGTISDVAHGLKDKGAKDVYAFLSHVVLNEAGVYKIEQSPIKTLVSTDTVECPAIKNSSKIKIISAAPLFAQAVYTIHERQPMSYMFGHLSDKLFEMSFSEQLSMFEDHKQGV